MESHSGIVDTDCVVRDDIVHFQGHEPCVGATPHEVLRVREAATRAVMRLELQKEELAYIEERAESQIAADHPDRSERLAALISYRRDMVAKHVHLEADLADAQTAYLGAVKDVDFAYVLMKLEQYRD